MCSQDLLTSDRKTRGEGKRTQNHFSWARNELKIIHTADNHIGEAQYGRIDSATGLNARSLDFLNSFKRITKITIEQKADILLIAGDFFTKVNPHPRYIYEVIKALKEVSNAGIKSIIIGGNHEAPRLSSTLNPLKLLEHIDDVHVVLEPRTISIDHIDFVCVPAPSNFDEIASLFNSMLNEAISSSNNETRVLVSHLPLSQSITSSERTMESFMGESVDVRQIPDKFAYMALGHIHKFQQIQFGTHPIYYPGSSERHDWSEEGEAKYVASVEISGSEVGITPIELQVRNMRTLIDSDCRGLSGSKITELVLSTVGGEKSSLADTLVRIKLENVDFNESRRIKLDEIKTALSDCGVFDLKFQPRTITSLSPSGQAKGEYVFPPSKEVELYIASREEYSGITEELMKLGQEIIKEAREQA